MPTYRLAWPELVTPGVTGLLAGAAGCSADDVPVETCVRILEHSIGLPFVEAELDQAAATAMGLKCLGEAIQRALAELRLAPPATPGFVSAAAGDAPYERRIQARPRVSVNTASPSELEPLPRIGPVLARQIVAERQANGPFASMAELVERIDGLGEAGGAAIESAVGFELPATTWARCFESTFAIDADLRLLLAISPGATAKQRLERVLDYVATTCAANPHPEAVRLRVRRDPPPLLPPAIEARHIGVLANGAYYAELPALLDAAAARLDVCMFHIALPEPGHPTRVLLDAVVRARQRGVTVRVLVDRDRPTDVYRSTIINSAALAFLRENSVACRVDPPELLLHSKFLLIDDELAIVGSHNWSAGSYFAVDDLSLAIWSAGYRQAMDARFEALWNAAQESDV